MIKKKINLKKKYLDENENISELEKKEIEKLDSFLDGEDKDLLIESENNKIKTNKNKNVTIFKSIDYNDFPKTKFYKSNNNKKKIQININKKKIEDEDLLEENNIENNEDKEYDDLDNEINLEE